MEDPKENLKCFETEAERGQRKRQTDAVMEANELQDQFGIKELVTVEQISED
jgi:hypothetical protein